MTALEEYKRAVEEGPSAHETALYWADAAITELEAALKELDKQWNVTVDALADSEAKVEGLERFIIEQQPGLSDKYIAWAKEGE